MGKRRSSGEGYPFPVKTGWKIVLTIGWRTDPQTGKPKRITKTKTLPTKADVLAWAAQFRAERKASQGQSDAPTELTFREWATIFLEDAERDKATNTHQRCRDVLERFVLPTLGRVPLLDLKPLAFRNLLSELETDYAGTRTLDSVYEVAKTCLMAAVKMELIPRNPVSQIPRPKYRRKDIQPFELEEIWLIFARSRPHRLHALLLLAFVLGLRQGELFALEWRDVDFAAGTIRIERQAISPRGKLEIKPPKSKAGLRTLEMSPDVRLALEDRRKIAVKEGLAACPLVFPGAHGAYLRSNTFAKRHWKPILKTCGLKERGLHHARHTFATHALLSGEPLPAVSKILGHASPTVTLNIYSHLVGLSQAETLCRVSSLFATTSQRHPATLKNSALESPEVVSFQRIGG